ncbi:hypothetical protein BraRD5C2_67100 [Bradyrhizobium sp. RD5-C2]|nr:hypothetical protein BraRD5C2_67100 [Bradyrhizobium sp. RD5-C2]
MVSVYDLLRQRCGLSQQDAANFHNTRIDTIKSWCSDRRTAPAGALDELRDLYADIAEAGRELADIVRLRPQTDEKGALFYYVGTPLSVADAVKSGFPCEGSCLAAVALAVTMLSGPAKLIPQRYGEHPTAFSRQQRQTARVTVYHFKFWDASSGDYIVPERKSTRERINMIGAEILDDTAERVETRSLDNLGRYTPASGSIENHTDMSPRARGIAKLHGLDGWVSAKPSSLRIDGVPRVAFTFRDGNEVHFEAGILRRLALELSQLGEIEAARSIEVILKQLVGVNLREAPGAGTRAAVLDRYRVVDHPRLNVRPLKPDDELWRVAISGEGNPLTALDVAGAVKLADELMAIGESKLAGRIVKAAADAAEFQARGA